MTVAVIMSALVLLILIGTPIGIALAMLAVGTMWWAVGPIFCPC